MRKLLLTTAAVAAICLAGCSKKPAQEAVSITYDTLTDKRDGQKYKLVKMPNGKTWMAQNLNYETDSSWCYENSADSCNKYGRLYNWDTAKKACPAGWKLPDTADWRKLVIAVGSEDEAGRKLKAKSGWNENGNGTNDLGFSALPGGGRNSESGFYYAGNNGFWWTATELVDNLAYFRLMYYHVNYVFENYYLKSYGLSVRCLED